MLEQNPRLVRFSEDFVGAYSGEEGYLRTRRRAAGKLIHHTDGFGVNESATAFAAEFLTRVCFKPLNRFGYTSNFAPESLESGGAGRKGIDIIISGAHPVAGLNVKLSAVKPGQLAPRHFYDPDLQCPGMNVHLGNWGVVPREYDSMTPPLGFRDWLEIYALPHIGGSGKLPHMDDFRSYVLSQVSATVRFYLTKLELYRNGQYTPGIQEKKVFPQTLYELQLLQQKLEETDALFCSALSLFS